MTAKILGWRLGLARAIGAVLFIVVTGLVMSIIFRKDDAARTKEAIAETGSGRRTANHRHGTGRLRLHRCLEFGTNSARW